MKKIFTLVIATAISMVSFAQTYTKTGTANTQLGNGSASWSIGSPSSATLTKTAMVSNALVFTNFNYSSVNNLQNNSAITSLSVTFTMSGDAAVMDSSVRIVLNGAFYGGAAANAVTKSNPMPATSTQVTYSFPYTALAGLKGSDVKNSTFGIAVTTMRTSNQATNFGVTVANAAQAVVGTGALAPIILTDFTVSKNADNQVDIRFATSTEDNVQTLYVQRSSNGKDFENLFTLQPKGAANVYTKYAVVDRTPLQGNNYYRVAEMDKNGRWYYYITKMVTIESAVKKFSSYYNGGQVVANISNIPGSYDVSIIDLSGVTITRKQVNMTGRSAQLVLDAPSRAGVYMVVLKGQGVSESTRISVIK